MTTGTAALSCVQQSQGAKRPKHHVPRVAPPEVGLGCIDARHPGLVQWSSPLSQQLVPQLRKCKGGHLLRGGVWADLLNLNHSP